MASAWRYGTLSYGLPEHGGVVVRLVLQYADEAVDVVKAVGPDGRAGDAPPGRGGARMRGGVRVRYHSPPDLEERTVGAGCCKGHRAEGGASIQGQDER